MFREWTAEIVHGLSVSASVFSLYFLFIKSMQGDMNTENRFAIALAVTLAFPKINDCLHYQKEVGKLAA